MTTSSSPHSGVRPSPTAPQGPLESVVARSVDAIDRCRPVWEALRQGSDFPAPAADPDRYAALMKAFEGRSAPHVAAFSGGGAPCAVIIGRTERRGLKCRVGYVRIPTPRLRCLNIVHGGVLTDGSPEAGDAVAEHILGLLLSGEFGHIMVNKISIEHGLFGRLSSLRNAVRREIRTHWVTELVPGSFEKTMAHHKPKHRSGLRRVDRRLCDHFQQKVELRLFTRPDEVPEFLAMVGKIWPHTYQAGLGAGNLDTPVFRAMMLDAAERGRLRSYVLLGDGEPVVYHNGYVTGEWYHSEGTAFLPAHRALRPGTVLLMRLFQDLCEHGFRWIDWGFGDSEYKRYYGTRSWDDVNLHYYAGGPAARLAGAIDRGSLLASSALSAALGPRLIGKMRTGWRHRLEAPSEGQE